MLEHTQHLWPEYRGARMLITGATGFVGSWMLESLLHADRAMRLGVRVIALVRDPEAFGVRLPHLAVAEQVSVATGDVRAADVPGTFTHVVHCASAATPQVNAEHPDEVVSLIVDGTSRMLAVAARNPGTRFLQMSSGSVYGRQPPSLAGLPESHPGTPDASTAAGRFGAAKRSAEALGTRAVSEGTHAVAARGFGLIGPRLPLDGQFAIGNFLGDAAAGRPVEIHGDGTPVRSWLHAADLAAWCWTLLARGRAGTACNVGSDEAVTIGEAAARVAALTDPPLPVVRNTAPTPGTEPSRFVPDIAHARAEFGLDVWIPFDAALRRTWEWVVQ